jgi:hypothetical protein
MKPWSAQSLDITVRKNQWQKLFEAENQRHCGVCKSKYSALSVERTEIPTRCMQNNDWASH